MKFNNIFKSVLLEASTVTLYHGGKDLEYDHREIKSNASNSWEYGPGLYLTSSLMTAKKYAKGGKKLYSVEVELDKQYNSKNIKVSMDNVKEFIRLYVPKTKGKIILDDLQKRLADNGMVYIDYLVNLLLNDNALSANKTKELRKFMVDNGAKYSMERALGGTIVVVIDPSIVKKVSIIKANDIPLEKYDIDITKD